MVCAYCPPALRDREKLMRQSTCRVRREQPCVLQKLDSSASPVQGFPPLDCKGPAARSSLSFQTALTEKWGWMAMAPPPAP